MSLAAMKVQGSFTVMARLSVSQTLAWLALRWMQRAAWNLIMQGQLF